MITPYHYTYLNFMNGKKENRYKKFENDYWGATLKELIENFDIDKQEKILISTCGTNDVLIKEYFEKEGYYNLRFVPVENANYIVMTNRTTFKSKNTKNVEDIINCFDKHPGKNISLVKRNRQILSVIRKIN